MSDNQTKHVDNATFDPVGIFPARIKTRHFKARSISAMERAITGAGGMTDLIKGEAILPTDNNSYCRTIRLHEALHGIYTAPPDAERVRSKRPYSVLEQGQEDARLHLTCAKTTGVVRRDELATALHDLHGATTKRTLSASAGDSDVQALIALRSAAMIKAQDDLRPASLKRCVRSLKRLCGKVKCYKPDGGPYFEAMNKALELIREEKHSEATEVLKPYFSPSTEKPMTKAWPMIIIYGKSKTEYTGDKFEADVNFAKIEGKVGTVAASMLDEETLKAIREGTMPKLYIHHLFAQHNIKTYHGADEKFSMSGLHISAKKLALTVGPVAPRLFVKRIKRNGGTVLIDASSSMSISPQVLLKLILSAPMATIAFYNAPDDGCMAGNLWVFSHNGKRAANFSGVRSDRYDGRNGIQEHQGTNYEFNNYGGGNVVDFQAMQWLLTCPKPRYILTDAGWTGPDCTVDAADNLLKTAIARKQIIHVSSLKEMNTLLAQGVTVHD